MSTCTTSGPAAGFIEGECEPIDIGCVPQTTGEPTWTPNMDQLPIAVDPSNNCLWYYVCDNVGWIQICPGSICNLDEVDVSVVNDICNALNIPVTYSINGTCVEGVITLQDLADQLQECLDIADTCCYEPVVIEANAPIAFNNACYQLSDNVNTGERLMDSRTGTLDGANGTMPLNWSFTNPTNQTGVLTVKANMWANRTRPGQGAAEAGIPAQVLFMIGRRDRVDLYPLDPDAVTTQADGAHPDVNVSYDIRELPLEEVYGFWGRWRGVTCLAGVDCPVSRETTADITHEFVVAAGATVNISAFIAVGYRNTPPPGGYETGWFGARMSYVFEGQNQVA